MAELIFEVKGIGRLYFSSFMLPSSNSSSVQILGGKFDVGMVLLINLFDPKLAKKKQGIVNFLRADKSRVYFGQFVNY